VDTAAGDQPLMATQAICESANTDDIELLATGGTSLRHDVSTGRVHHRLRERYTLHR